MTLNAVLRWSAKKNNNVVLSIASVDEGEGDGTSAECVDFEALKSCLERVRLREWGLESIFYLQLIHLVYLEIHTILISDFSPATL